ncbi:MAG: T9SS type A sorting domain-containing protein [Bacteroidetes bacterium]|nr:T9SS type A sorting domain-containing protein [Bacteroidota bacterium]
MGKFIICKEKSFIKIFIFNPISEVDLSNQANGIYIVKIYDGQTILTKKIVIQ